MAGVGMPKRHDRCARETCAGRQAGVRHFVDENEIARADQRGDEAEIGEIAGAEDAGRLRLLEPRQARLQFAEQGMIPAHEA
jgi:hypothetical protein